MRTPSIIYTPLLELRMCGATCKRSRPDPESSSVQLCQHFQPASNRDRVSQFSERPRSAISQSVHQTCMTVTNQAQNR